MAQKPLRIFYSWQSWTPSARNRQFIEESLEQTLKRIEDANSQSIIIDRDTKGLPGAPAIADAILEKIEQCDIFLADVSLVLKDDSHQSPNPNVMLELGYAVKCLGWNRIILVMNDALGSPKQLPFDLIHRRWPLSYTLKSGQQKANEQAQLIGGLKSAIDTILHSGLPDTDETITEMVERFIERNETISLDKLLRSQIEQIYQEFNSRDFFERRDILLNDSHIVLRELWNDGFELYFHKCESDLFVFLSLAWYGRDGQTKYVGQAIKRWLESSPNNPKPSMIWKYIPSLFLIYTVGIAAVSSENWDFLGAIFSGEKIQHPEVSYRLDYPSSIIIEYIFSDHWKAQQPNNSTLGYPLGKKFKELLLPLYARMINSDDTYTHVFHVFEFLLAIQFLHVRTKSKELRAFSIPRYFFYGDIDARYYRVEKLLDLIETWGRQGANCELLKRGLFDGSSDRLLEMIELHQKHLSETQHGRSFGTPDYAAAYKKGMS
jgi:hypothetical protein